MIGKRILKGVGATTISQLANIMVQLLLVPVLVSHWGLERYGVWLLIATIPAYLQISDLGFAQAANVEIVLAVARNDRDRALAIFQSAWLTVLALTLIVLFAIAAVSFALPLSTFGTSGAVAPQDVREALILMSAYGCLILFGQTFGGGFRSTGNFATEALSAGILWVVEGAAVIAAASAGVGLVGLAWTYLIVRFMGLTAVGAVMFRIVPWLRLGVEHATIAQARSLIAPAIAAMGIPLANALVLQGTTLAIGWAAGAAAVPAFNTVRTLSRVALQLGNMVTRPIMPEFGVAVAKNDRLLQTRLILLVVAATAVIAVPISMGLLAFGPQIIALWTRGVVHPPELLLVLMALELLLNSSWTQLSTFLIAVNEQRRFTWILLALCLLSTPVTYVLARSIGDIAGAIGMLFVDLGMLVIILRLVSRLFATPSEIAAGVLPAYRHARAGLQRLRS